MLAHEGKRVGKRANTAAVLQPDGRIDRDFVRFLHARRNGGPTLRFRAPQGKPEAPHAAGMSPVSHTRKPPRRDRLAGWAYEIRTRESVRNKLHLNWRHNFRGFGRNSAAE